MPVMAKNNKHRKPNDKNKLGISITVAGAGLSLPLVMSNTAQAATMSEWEKVAQCESNSQWNRPDGDNGLSSGGLQFQIASWNDAVAELKRQGVDTSGFTTGSTHQAYKHTKEQQILAGEALLALQGPRAWAVTWNGGAHCGNLAGGALTTGSMFEGGPNPFEGGIPTDPAPDPDPQPTPDEEEEIPDTSGAFAPAVLELVNKARTDAGLTPLVLDDSLSLYAGEHVAEMAARGKLYHSEMDFEGSPRGENVAMGQDTAEEVFQAWMDSEGHKANILGADYTRMGLAAAEGNDGMFWTQVFAGGDVTTPEPEPEPEPEPDPDEEPTPEAGEKYTVKPGDYLVKIADEQDVYGGWEALYEANKSIIGPDPDLIHPGQIFTLPLSDPYEFSGVPQANQASPSAKPLQKELKRTGYMPQSVPEHDNYGPKTQKAVALFHRAHPEYTESRWDVQIGPKGWKHLLEMQDATTPSAAAPAAPKAPQAHGKWASPVSHSVTQRFGNPGNYSAGYHTGIDFTAPTGTPVACIGDGEVVKVGGEGASYGNHILVKHTDGKYSLYAHLNAVSVAVGQTVSAGTVIGTVGSTGNSTGPHLHFEVRGGSGGYWDHVDPVSYLRAKGVKLS